MSEDKKKFEDISSEHGNIISEFIEFLKHNKKLWLLPIIIVLILLGLLIMLGGTSAAPFIYTLF